VQPILSVNRNNTGCTGCYVMVKCVIWNPILSVKLNNLECTGFGVVVNVVTLLPLLIYIYISEISGQPTISRICIYIYRRIYIYI
jgi:hypothetical protein